MKKGIKVIPFALAALLLVGCSSSSIGPSNGKNPIVGDNGTTYQEFYDEMYASIGAEYAAKELILQVSKDVYNKSENFKDLNIYEERKNDVLDEFYTSSYKKDGLFQERLLVEDLQSKGYKIIVPEDGKLFEETEDLSNLVKYQGLHSVLKADYSDYFAKKADYDIYSQLLKEEYILTQKVDYFKTKKIRKVQYFTFTPNDSNAAIEIKEALEKELTNDKMSFDEFKTLSETKFQSSYEKVALDKVAKDYAVINDNPTTEAELKYKDLYIKDYFVDDGNGNMVINDKLSDTQKTKVKDAMNTYTNNGAYSKEFGYLLKQLEVYNTLGYKEKTMANDDTTGALVEASIDTKLFKTTREDEAKSNFLDFTDQGSKVFKSGTSYYVVRYEIIDETTTDKALKVEGANALTKNSTNVKNAVSYYLEQYGVNVYEQALYDYLKETYGFEK
ncbi:MAG: hypothetical protein SO253_03700 [Bacilli bacterium]|nr:hypothetical protein [Bacilli bacterium]